jgi:hypothetical protein
VPHRLVWIRVVLPPASVRAPMAEESSDQSRKIQNHDQS